MKIIIIGINHAGTSALRTLYAQDKNHTITAYDRNDNISFLGCGIALAVGGIVDDVKNLFYCSPLKLEEMGATIRMNHEVLAIDYKNKTIQVKNLKTEQVFTDSYDTLIYAAGSWPLEIPHVSKQSRNLKNIEICKLYQHAKELIDKGNDPSIRTVAVIGSGYIGVELAEAYHKKGKVVTLIDAESRVLPRYFDSEFTDILENDIRSKGIALALGERVVDFLGENGKVTRVITDKNSHHADLVIVCIGFKPNTHLLPDAKKNNQHALIVDASMKTSLPDIYAIGDAVALYHAAIEAPIQVALATNAVKSGIVAASAINGNNQVTIESVVGTNAICVFENKLASTGISFETAQKLGKKCAFSYIEDNDRPEFMQSFNKTRIKLVYDTQTLRLLGAQIGCYGETNHTEVIYYLALAIQRKLTLLDIAFTDVYFLPHFNKPFNFVLTAIMQAIGLNYYKN